MASDLIEQIQKIALAGVVKPDFEAWLRGIQRWFSKNFHTPLLEVEDLPVQYVLLHYFEHHYSEMEKDDLIKQVQDLLETPEERAARINREELEEAEYLRRAMQQEAERANKKQNLLDEALKAKKESIKSKEIKPPEEEVKIQFVDHDLLEEEGLK